MPDSFQWPQKSTCKRKVAIERMKVFVAINGSNGNRSSKSSFMQKNIRKFWKIFSDINLQKR